MHGSAEDTTPRPRPGPRDGTQVWVRDERTLWRHTVEAVVLLPPGTEEPVVLNGSGPAIWELLADPLSTAELVGELARWFEVDEAQVRRDVTPVLAQLHDCGALTVLQGSR